MIIGQRDLRSRAGVLATVPRIVPVGEYAIVLNHAMDRPPDIAFLRYTNIVADAGWKPGQTFHLYPGGVSTPEFYIENKPGLVTATYLFTSLRGPAHNTNSSTALTQESWNVQLAAVWLALPASL